MEKKCEAKKKQNRRPRPRKPTKASDVGEVDLQLKGLMLGIESQSNAVPDAMKCHELNNLHNILGSEAFIDLSSPSPPLRACKLAKHQVHIEKQVGIIDVCESDTIDKFTVVNVSETETINTDKHVEVINICESETDASPEHERKARELRLFIKSIRKDLS